MWHMLCDCSLPLSQTGRGTCRASVWTRDLLSMAGHPSAENTGEASSCLRARTSILTQNYQEHSSWKSASILRPRTSCLSSEAERLWAKYPTGRPRVSHWEARSSEQVVSGRCSAQMCSPLPVEVSRWDVWVSHRGHRCAGNGYSVGGGPWAEGMFLIRSGRWSDRREGGSQQSLTERGLISGVGLQLRHFSRAQR